MVVNRVGGEVVAVVCRREDRFPDIPGTEGRCVVFADVHGDRVGVYCRCCASFHSKVLCEGQSGGGGQGDVMGPSSVALVSAATPRCGRRWWLFVVHGVFESAGFSRVLRGFRC